MKQNFEMRWWFRLNIWLPLKIIVLGFLLLQFVGACKSAFLQTCATIALMKAWLGLLGVILFGLETSLWTFIFPIWLAVLCFLVFPEAFSSPENTKTKATIHALLFIVGLNVLVWWNGFVIGKVADFDPDKAYQVGVTGSKPPSFITNTNAP